jgi:hypothetical protein
MLYADWSPYIEWAKLHSSSAFNLATSGVKHLSIGELGATIDDVELSGTSLYGYDPLLERVAAKLGVSPAQVVLAPGTSMANHLAMAALLRHGDEVLIERPTYDPLVWTAAYLGARVVRFDRRPEDGFRVDVDAVRRALTPRTRLVVVANLHNPSSVLTDQATLQALGEAAERVGAKVLVDEVYLDAVFDQTPPSCVHLGPTFVATSSLTKVYGLSGLRCGWIACQPQLAQRIWRLNDLFGVVPAHPAERLSVVALDRLPRILARTQALLTANRALLDRFLASRHDLDTVPTHFGTTVVPALRDGDVDRLCTMLRERYDTTVVPGRFFELPNHIRVGIGGDTEPLAQGLDRLGAALDDLAREG